MLFDYFLELWVAAYTCKKTELYTRHSIKYCRQPFKIIVKCEEVWTILLLSETLIGSWNENAKEMKIKSKKITT